jgi:hypothetical protein
MLPNKERAKSIYEMRTYIRREEKAIRGNTVVFKKLWDFIDSVVEGSEASPKTTRRTRKRKEMVDDDDDDDVEYPPSPTKKGKRRG